MQDSMLERSVVGRLGGLCGVHSDSVDTGVTPRHVCRGCLPELVIRSPSQTGGMAFIIKKVKKQRGHFFPVAHNLSLIRQIPVVGHPKNTFPVLPKVSRSS